jgi:RNA polymerase primary sigma factor
MLNLGKDTRMTHAITNTPHRTGLATYLSEINQTPLLIAAEEKELARRIQEGDTAARDQMIRANLRLVVNIGRSFHGRGVSLDDLIEDGNLGLIRAVERFDPAKNTRFSTYAAYWIKQAMTRSIGSARTLPLPSYVVQMLRDWRRESIGLEEELARRPTDEEINARLNLPERKIRIIKKAIKVLSSKRTGSSESESNFDEMLAIPTNGHENRVATKELLVKALNLLDGLDERDAKVLRMRFGLQGSEPMTFAKVGKCLSLTRERVRQIEIEALLKLHEKMDPPPSHEE